MNGPEPDFESFHAERGRHRARENFDAFWGSAPSGEVHVPVLPLGETIHPAEMTWTKLDDAQALLHTIRAQREQREKNQPETNERSES